MSSIQLIKYLQDNKLIKEIGHVFYLTDKLTAITNDVDSPKAALKQFCEDVELPYQVTSPSGKKYTIKYVNDRIGKVYLRVLQKVDKEDLIKVTKKYYEETEYPVTIRNYFEENVWEVALEAKDDLDTTSLNKFES